MAESVVGSKEVALAVIALALANIVQYTGIQFPLTPDQIYGAGISGLAILRIFFTNSKITSLLPQKPILPP
jgi:hypothetical protein